MSSYATIQEADEYWAERDSAWGEASEESRSAALVKATEWIDTEFSWIGQVESYTQALSWPRIRAIDAEGRCREGIPQELKNAVSWLAFQALSSELDPALDRGGDIRSVQAGSVAIEWSPGAPTGKTYRHVKRMLRNIITGNRLRRG